MPATSEIRIVKTAADLFEVAATEFANLPRKLCAHAAILCRTVRRFHAAKFVFAAGQRRDPSIPWDKIFSSGATNATCRPTIPIAITAWPARRCSPKFPFPRSIFFGFPAKKKMRRPQPSPTKKRS